MQDKSFYNFGLVLAAVGLLLHGFVRADEVREVERISAQIDDISIVPRLISAVLENRICISEYALSPFQVMQTVCAESEGLRLRNSKWSPASNLLAVARDIGGGGSESVAIYRYHTASKELDLVTSWQLNPDFPQRNSLSIVGWIEEAAVLISRGCGSSCVAYSVLALGGSASEPLGVISDLPISWDPRRQALSGVDRTGKLFIAEVNLDNPAMPTWSYSDHLEGCLGPTGWYTAGDDRYWYRFEERLPDGSLLTSTQPCDSGLTVNFGASSNVIFKGGFETQDRVTIGSPVSMSNNGQRLATLTTDGDDLYLRTVDSNSFATINELQVEGYNASSSVIGLDVDLFSPLWSPSDAWIVLPALVRGGNARVVSSSQSGETEIPNSSGRAEYVWLSDTFLLAKRADSATIYEAVDTP